MPNPYNRIKDRVKKLEERIQDLEDLQQSMQQQINELRALLQVETTYIKEDDFPHEYIIGNKLGGSSRIVREYDE